MAASAVSICSNALLLLGAKPINDFNEDSDRALLAANLYPLISRSVLRSHLWNCCVRRVALAPLVDAPVFDFSYQFPLPDDWVRTLQVGQYGAEVDFRTEGRKLLSDQNPLYLRYVAHVSEGDWDDLLVHTMTVGMAAAMAYAITKSTAVVEDTTRKAQMALRQAQAVDGQDDPNETLGDSRLYAAGFFNGQLS